MKVLNATFRCFANVQILSALIWAIAIIACSWVANKSNVSMILITAAGFHVILMAQLNKAKSAKEVQ